jgi:hypothetical protein
LLVARGCPLQPGSQASLVELLGFALEFYFPLVKGKGETRYLDREWKLQ